MGYERKDSDQLIYQQPASPSRNENSSAELHTISPLPTAGLHVFRLYVCGPGGRSMQAITRVRQLCNQHFLGRHKLEVIDIFQQPDEARTAEIVAVPTLIKESPGPLIRFIGDMANVEAVLVGVSSES